MVNGLSFGDSYSGMRGRLASPYLAGAYRLVIAVFFTALLQLAATPKTMAQDLARDIPRDAARDIVGDVTKRRNESARPASAIPARGRVMSLRDGRRVILREGGAPGRAPAKETDEPGMVDSPQPMTPETASIPAFFEQNVGQLDENALFVSRGSTYSLFVTETGFVSVVGRAPANSKDGSEPPGKYDAHAIGVTLINATKSKPTGIGKLRATAKRYIGNQKSRWQDAIPLFTALQYEAVYPGVDMVLSGKSGRLTFGFLLDKTADPESIQLRIDGARKIHQDKRGNLVIDTGSGPIVQTAPRFYQQTAKGTIRELSGGFYLAPDNVVGFKIRNRTAGLPLVIDPLIVFSTYFGGAGQEGMLGADGGALDTIGRGFDITVNNEGHVFVTGMTFSPDFPTTMGPVLNGSSDVFVMHLDPAAANDPLVYATFLGGTQQDRGRAIAATPAGDAFVTGFTFSADFPGGPEAAMFTPDHSGGFIARLDASGALNRSTMVSPRNGYHPNSIELEVGDDGIQRLYVGGWVTAAEAVDEGALATPGALKESVADIDGFVAAIDPDLTAYQYLTYLGGTRRDVIMDIAVRRGNVYATGVTNSFDFQRTEFAEQFDHSSLAAADVDCPTPLAPTCFDSFAVRIRDDGTGLVYGTYLGEGATEDFARGIAVSANRRAVVTGGSRPADEPGASYSFVTRLDSGGVIDYDVRLPGSGSDHGEEIVVDALGRAHFTGTISEAGPPAVGSAIEVSGVLVPTAEPFHGGDSDFFYGRIDDDGELNFFSYLGGSGTDRGFAVATIGDSAEKFCAHIVGSTTSVDLSLVNELQGELASGSADMALVSLCDFPIPPVIVKEGPETVAPGGLFQYTIVVFNAGDQPVDVSISDTVPSSVTVLGVVGCGIPAPGSNSFSCDRTVDGGDTHAIVVQALPPTTCGDLFTNTVTMTYEFEGEEVTVSDSQTTRVECCGNGIVDVGEQCDGGANCRSDCTRITCGDGILDPGEECDGGANCGAGCRIRVPPPSMGIEKWAEPAILCNGEEVNWHIRVSNTGDVVLEDVVAIDAPHPLFDFDAASIATCDEGSAGVRCDLLDIQPGGNRTFHLDGTVSGAPIICNPVSASASNYSGFNANACVEVKLCPGDPCNASSECEPPLVCGWTSTGPVDDDNSSPFCTVPLINIPPLLLGMCPDDVVEYTTVASCQMPGDGVTAVD